jgi:hypothetical protein
MPQTVITEGFDEQFDALDFYGKQSAHIWDVALSADTFPISESTTFSDVSVAVIGGSPVETAWRGWLSINLGVGDATASLENHTFTIEPNPTGITLGRYYVYSFADGVLIWAGDVSPPLTPSPTLLTTPTLTDVSVVLGQCSASAPFPTVLVSDSFAGSGTTTLGSHTPLIGGSWSVNFGGLLVHSNTCTAESIGDNLAFIETQSPPVTITWGYVHATGTQPNIWFSADSATLNSVDVVNTGTQWEIVRKISGVPTVEATASQTLVSGDTYTLTTVIQDDWLVLTVNGVYAIAYGPLGTPSYTLSGFDLYEPASVPAGVALSFTVTTP